MKVLWFSNTPAAGEEFLRMDVLRAGWLSSLAKVLKDKVELSVAFYYVRFSGPFKYKGVSYFPICKKNWKLDIIKKNILGDFIYKEDLPVYLEIINKVQPDIIHIHGTENPFGCLIDEVDIPVVVSIQGNCTVYNHKFYSGIERSYASVKDIKILSPYTWIFNKSYNQRYRNSSLKITEREKIILKRCKHIIGRTDWDRRITRILAPDSEYYHNDEALRECYYRNEWGGNEYHKLIIHSTIGESIFKGFETICQALNELNKIGIDSEWRVAGVTEQGLLNKVVKKKLRSSYPARGLVFLGNLNESELVTKMLEAGIYVMPSHIENSPNSLCEAMILGMPCITTHAGGSSSLLKDKEEGLVIQDGDPWSMAGAILELSANKTQAVLYGQKARDRALTRHNIDKIVNELLMIYNKVRNS